MPPRRHTVHEKRALIREYEEIQLITTQRDYCQLHNLNESTFSKWLSAKEKLEKTAGHKKNAQREPTYRKDSRLLIKFLDEQHTRQQQVSLLQLLAHVKNHGLLRDMKTYMDRYLFCRRTLYAHAQRSTSNILPTIFGHQDCSASAPDSAQDRYGDYQLITQNVYQDRPPLQDWNFGLCSCDTTCGADCINQATATECTAANCSIQGQCGNKWLANTIENSVKVFQTEKTNSGLRSLVDIPPNTVILEYCGEYMLETTYSERCKATHPPPTTTYFMRCEDGYGIDARIQGSIARFANHACQANLKVAKRLVGHITRIFFVTKRAITRGEELTIKYDNTVAFTCLCSGCQDVPHP